jgi:hypothetical protein|tara:strand:+ start:232 stop:594 length:363 start_codon:yes stop_codon:yes gene_type:complete
MPLITIGFNQEINVSVQVGDLAWYVPTNTQGVQGNQYQTNDVDNIVLIGPITAINGNVLTIDKDISITPPLITDFIMFSKDRRSGVSGVLGYYANVKLRNNSKDKIELFAVGSEIFESSK